MNIQTETDQRQGETGPTNALNDEKLAYQSFTLPDGRATPGYDRSYLNPIIFGSDFTRRSLLDIGSYLGYFCVEAMKRNASRAVGIEPDPESVRKARLLAEVERVQPEYLCADFETWVSSGQSFDTVICLNVLHHMFDAVGAIQKMMSLARRHVLIEFVGPELSKRIGLSLNPFGSHAPVIFLGSPNKSHDALKRTFMFTPEAMRVLFNTLTSMFEPVVITRSPFKESRYLLDATKRQIDNLVVIAGPTASGKSTLINKIETDAALSAKLGVVGGKWHVPRGDTHDLPKGPLENVILHYDLLRPFRRSVGTHARDPWTDFMKIANRVTVITLMPSRKLLRDRILSPRSNGGKAESKRHRDIYERYETPAFLDAWYQAWFSFCGGLPNVNRNMIITTDEAVEQIAPATAWKERFSEVY